MNYPFDFYAMPLTSGSLDALGFSTYNSGPGEYGTRVLSMGNSLFDPKRECYVVIKFDETDDPDSGYGLCPMYCPEHIVHEKDYKDLYFLHDMIESIKDNCSEKFYDNFIEITKKRGVNMNIYVESYLQFKNK